MRAHFDRIGHTVSEEVARKSCLDKVRYPSRNRARDRAVLIVKQNPERPALRPYRCTICGDFHLTSNVPNPGGQILTTRRAQP